MPNIFALDDYRNFVAQWSDETGVTYRKLAQSVGVHTSYFSRVMVGKAEFSQEQLFQIGAAMKLAPEERDYLLLLGQFHSSGNTAHKRHVRAQIDVIQRERLRLINRLGDTVKITREERATYYAEAVTARIHMYLTIERFRKSPQLIAKALRVSDAKLNGELSKLESLGIIERQKRGEISVKLPFVHIEETDALAPLIHQNWRLEAIDHIKRRVPQPNDHHLSVVFTTDEEGRLRIKERFREFVVKAREEASRVSQSAEVFVMCFDLFGAESAP